MKKIIKYLLAFILVMFLIYMTLGYVSSYIGWYGYKKWAYRTGSKNITESKNRGVFIKELNYQIEGYDGTLSEFKPFLEKGFRFGRHSKDETIPLSNSNFPYQLGFDSRPKNEITILIQKDQLAKFDSSNSVWGYLKDPEIKDTIILTISENNHSGIIRVWQ